MMWPRCRIPPPVSRAGTHFAIANGCWTRRPSSSGGDGEKVPIAQIAEHAGVGVGTVYRHFPTREDLLGALVYRSFGLAVDNARAAAAHPGSALEGVRAFFLATLRDRERFVLPLHGGPAIFTPATRQRQATGSHRPAWTDRARAGRRRAARGPDPRGPDRGRIAAVPATSRHRRLERLARRQIDLMISGLAPAGPSTTRPQGP